MTANFLAIEHKLQALREVDPTVLELKDRIVFYKEMIGVLSDKIKEQLQQFQYKSALTTEAVRKDYQKRLAGCYSMLTEAEADKLNFVKPEVVYVKSGDDSRFIRITIEEIKSKVNTILYGVPCELQYDGEGLFIKFLIPSLDITNEFARLEEFAKESKFKLLDAKKKKLKENLLTTTEEDNTFYLRVTLGDIIDANE